MAIFTYIAKTKSHTVAKGRLEASNRTSALTLLKERDLVPITVKEEHRLQVFGKRGKRISLRALVLFTQQFAVMIRSGVPIVDALQTLGDQSDNKHLKIALDKITSDVKGGTAMSDAFAESGAFPPLYVSVLRSGEKSGKLDAILLRLSNQLQKDYETKSKLKGALLLPEITLVLLVGVVLLILVFVMPQLTSIFTESGVALPLPTRILLGSSTIVRNYWYIFVILIITGIVGYKFYAATKNGRLNIDRWRLKIPILGSLTQKAIMSRFAGTMSTLLSSGMPMLEILKTTSDVLDNKAYEEALTKASAEVETGVKLSEALSASPLIPPLVTNMISIGEKSGHLETVLGELTTFYEQEVDDMARNLSTLIEPIITVVLGLGVGFVVISVIGPIYKLVNAI